MMGLRRAGNPVDCMVQDATVGSDPRSAPAPAVPCPCGFTDEAGPLRTGPVGSAATLAPIRDPSPLVHLSECPYLEER